MSSDQSKKAIVEYLRRHKITTAEKDWKRTSKRTIAGNVVRMFECAAVPFPVMTHIAQDEEDGAYYDEFRVIPAGADLVYMVEEFECVSVMITPKSYYDLSGGAMYDQHSGWFLAGVWNVPDWITVEEASENCFMIEDRSIDEVIAVMDALGAVRVTQV